jgi:hypothetical protein
MGAQRRLAAPAARTSVRGLAKQVRLWRLDPESKQWGFRPASGNQCYPST